MEVMLGQLVGALIPTFLLSRLLLWITRSWDGGVGRYVTVHAATLVLASLIGGMGMADGGAFAPIEAASVYVLPQLFWLIVDLMRTSTQRQANDLGRSAPGQPRTVGEPSATRAEIAFWESIQNSSNAADFEAYLRQYPDGTFARLAQNRLTALGRA